MIRKVEKLLVILMASSLLCSCANKEDPAQTLPMTTVSILESEGETADAADLSQKMPDQDENLYKDEVHHQNVPVVEIPGNEEYVRMADYIPGLVVELRYATENNFTGEKIYDFNDAYLRYGTVKKLAKVQEQLQEQGLGLKVWDAYRPFEAQVRLWEVCPNPAYVANPSKGATGHCAGCTVDITLVDASGKELKMPTEFDSFSTLADRDYSDCDEEAASNALLLEELMIANGFKPYKGEWWDFTDCESYGGRDDFVPPYDSQILKQEGKDWVSELKVAETTSQMIVVTVPRENSQKATLSMHTKDAKGNWREILSTDAIVAKDGIGKAHEGQMITPKGEYGFVKAFGILASPGTRMDYQQVDENDYWVDDSNSRYYNRFVDAAEVETDWNSAEHIVSVGSAYDYVLALDYNSECIPEEGSAIFLHVAVGDYTAGCIGVSKKDMVKILNSIHLDCRIIIDTEEEIQNY
ncbi:MAG: M15 family metallopeptidase [Lachnospiraceae bacterium]